MASAPSPVTGATFFGYWSGELPQLAQLHFRSFLRHHPDARYELWLDIDAGSAVDAPELQWLKLHPRVQLRGFSLNRLIGKHMGIDVEAASAPSRLRRLRRAVHAVHRVVRPGWTRRKAWDHEVYGLTYMHSSRLFPGFAADRTYRADVARLLIAREHYAQPSVGCSLDVCFTGDLTPLCGAAAFVFRRQRHGFADNAIVYLPGASWSEALARKAIAIETFRPWILLSDETCAELGIALHPGRLIDPLRDDTSLLYGDTAKFFGSRKNLALDLHALSIERHLAIHWHGQWDAVPARTSIYAGLLKAAEEATAG